ncbi:MAG: hypothetical protein O7A64_08850 [Alphaproteobacteria bacterium]|nr:hypothetical protein [Alphaproteobacteria bacterium]
MTKETYVTPQEIIEKAKDLARIHGHVDASPPNDGPAPLRTPPDGVGGFHINFGGEYSPNTKATYVEIFQGGKRAGNEIRHGKAVFEAVFFTGRENDPHKLFLKFDPENDWRKDFLSLDSLSPDSKATNGS